MYTYSDVVTELAQYAHPDKAKSSMWFFKTGPGEYGEGDVFIGVTIPETRKIVKKVYRDISLQETAKLIKSPVHEHRVCGLIILSEKAARADDGHLSEIVTMYLSLTEHINNWDLVDTSAYKILGRYLENHPEKRDTLYTLAHSNSLWEQRISIIATLWFIRKNDFKDTFAISQILIDHPHDLMHKAVGWMLREVGNRDQAQEEGFLIKHYKDMPRTMLRYAIERFDEPKRRAYLDGKI